MGEWPADHRRGRDPAAAQLPARRDRSRWAAVGWHRSLRDRELPGSRPLGLRAAMATGGDHQRRGIRECGPECGRRWDGGCERCGYRNTRQLLALDGPECLCDRLDVVACGWIDFAPLDRAPRDRLGRAVVDVGRTAASCGCGGRHPGECPGGVAPNTNVVDGW